MGGGSSGGHGAVEEKSLMYEWEEGLSEVTVK